MQKQSVEEYCLKFRLTNLLLNGASRGAALQNHCAVRKIRQGADSPGKSPHARPAKGASGAHAFSRDRRVAQDPVLLRPGLRLVVLVEVLDRAFSLERARQDHHPDEAARAVHGGLGKNRVRPALVPSPARTVGGRAAMGVDADAAFDEAADAGSLVPVEIGASAGRERDTVAAHQEIAWRQGVEPGGEFLARCDAGRSAATWLARRKLPTPAGHAVFAGAERDRILPVPSLSVAERAPRDGDRAVHDEDHARERRQAGL